ncbi:hypothetical protein V9T40_005894 [Parthenolecanium corni]|uniref:Uncharacterized protein n=1 Tax=Parthenolecanium corni TaxID=536013 RepID=A0AAN9TV10_9HEMI
MTPPGTASVKPSLKRPGGVIYDATRITSKDQLASYDTSQGFSKYWSVEKSISKFRVASHMTPPGTSSVNHLFYNVLPSARTVLGSNLTHRYYPFEVDGKPNTYPILSPLSHQPRCPSLSVYNFSLNPCSSCRWMEKTKRLEQTAATSWSVYALECPRQPPHLGVFCVVLLFSAPKLHGCVRAKRWEMKNAQRQRSGIHTLRGIDLNYCWQRRW